MNTDLKYKNLIQEYLRYNENIKELEREQERIKTKIAQMLHEDRINSKIIDIDNEPYFCGFQSATRNKVNYELLFEYLTEDQYNNVVETKESTFMVIRKTTYKNTEKDVLHKKPDEDLLKEPKKNSLSGRLQIS